MIVSELIRKLQKLPPNAKIYHLDGEYGVSEPEIDYIKELKGYWISESEVHVEY